MEQADELQLGKIGEHLIIPLNLEGILDREETEEIAAKKETN
jgi:hypothetical protein